MLAQWYEHGIALAHFTHKTPDVVGLVTSVRCDPEAA
jgi:hypothetical protein